MEELYKNYIRYDPSCSRCYELQSVNLNKTFWERLYSTTLKSNKLYPLQDVHNLLSARKSSLGGCGCHSTRRRSSTSMYVTSLDQELSLNESLHSKHAKASAKTVHVKPIAESVLMSPFNECWPEPAWVNDCAMEDAAYQFEIQQPARRPVSNVVCIRRVSRQPSLPTIMECQPAELTNQTITPNDRGSLQMKINQSIVKQSATQIAKSREEKQKKALAAANRKRKIMKFQQKLINSQRRNLINQAALNAKKHKRLSMRTNETVHLGDEGDASVKSEQNKFQGSRSHQANSGSTMKTFNTESSWATLNSTNMKQNPPVEGSDLVHVPVLTRDMYKSFRFRRALHHPWSHFGNLDSMEDDDIIDTLSPTESLVNILNTYPSLPVLKRIEMYRDLKQSQESHISESDRSLSLNNESSSSTNKLTSSINQKTTGLSKTALSTRTLALKNGPSKTQTVKPSVSFQVHQESSIRATSSKPYFSHRPYAKSNVEMQLLSYISGILNNS